MWWGVNAVPRKIDVRLLGTDGAAYVESTEVTGVAGEIATQ